MKALVTTLALAVFALTPLHAETLAEMMEEVGIGKVIGTWVDEDTKGEQLTVSYKWQVKGHALSINVKSENGQSSAFVAVDPESGEAIHISVDQDGVMSKGAWGEEEGLAVLNLERPNDDGGKIQMQVSHKIADGKLIVGLKVPDAEEAMEVVLVRKGK